MKKKKHQTECGNDGGVNAQVTHATANEAWLCESQEVIERVIVYMQPPDEPDVHDGMKTIKPWPRPVDGAELLDEIVGGLNMLFEIPDAKHINTAALWILCNRLLDASQRTAELCIGSPPRPHGYVSLAAIICFLYGRPVTITWPLFYTKGLMGNRPVRRAEKGDAYLNADTIPGGISKNNSTKPRLNDFHASQTKDFALTDQVIRREKMRLEDRVLAIHLWTQSLKEDDLPWWKNFPDQPRKLLRWAMDNQEALATVKPTIPAGIHGHTRDDWRPLLAVAEVVGGAWPEAARNAAEYHAVPFRKSTLVRMLLADLQTVYANVRHDFVSTDQLVSALSNMDERPWRKYAGAGCIRKVTVAAILRPLGIQPRLVKTGRTVEVGYLESDFREAFKRYVVA